MRRILIVDDEAVVRNYVRRALSSRGCEVTEAAGGGEALALLAAGGYDALICDLKMPDMRGEEVIKKAAALRPGMKLIVITGSVSDVPDPVAPGVKADGCLIKPFGIGEIRDLVASLLPA